MEQFQRARKDGRDVLRIPMRGTALLANPLYNRGTAFTEEERDALGLTGLLPDHVSTFDEQCERAFQQVQRLQSPLDRYVALTDIEARNAVLFYRIVLNHLEELLPVVYTPTVGKVCQEYSHIFRRGRGLWITPGHRGRIAEVLRHAPYAGVKLIVVTDNERILGLGDQGAGGMGIPIGKLALYTVGAGFHPADVLPISLDVGTDNQAKRDDPLYLGWREPRLRGAPYDELVEEFVEAVREVFPEALLQWEDFKKVNAMRLLDTYRDRILSFNDDIQGTAGIALAGVIAAARISATPMAEQRVVMLGAGAAGLGIARLIREDLRAAGLQGEDLMRSLAVLDSRGLLSDARDIREEHKRELAWPKALAEAAGLADPSGADLLTVVKALKPTVLIGTSGTPGVFTEEVVRAMAAEVERPAIFPYSNPTSKSEAKAEDLVRWTDGRALIASGSPFAPVEHGGRTQTIAQGNNVYVFPGVGLGVLAAGGRRVADSVFTTAAHAIAALVSPDALAAGDLYPRLGDLRSISRTVAVAVAEHLVAIGDAPSRTRPELEARIDEAMWLPCYADLDLDLDGA